MGEVAMSQVYEQADLFDETTRMETPVPQTAEEVDAIVSQCTEKEIRECGWLELGNGYLGPLIILPNGKTHFPFWEKRRI